MAGSSESGSRGVAAAKISGHGGSLVEDFLCPVAGFDGAPLLLQEEGIVVQSFGNGRGFSDAGEEAVGGIGVSGVGVGVSEKGLGAEELTIRLIIPAGATVVETTGDGYKGVSMDEKAKANVAVWSLAKLEPKAHHTYTITLSKAGTAADNLRGEVHWAKPAMKSGKGDQNAIAPAPL